MISIITPFYNEEHTIISFIETVLSRINDKNTIEEFILVNVKYSLEIDLLFIIQTFEKYRILYYFSCMALHEAVMIENK